jgi:chorismate mutase/prephenate dehydratase
MEELDLQAIRKKIDELDKELAHVLTERLDTVLKVAQYKEKHNLPVFDAEREKKVLEKVQALMGNPAYAKAMENVMKTIMDQSKELEVALLAKHIQEKDAQAEPVRVGYQGVNGSYGHQALEEYFTGRPTIEMNFTHFEDVVQAIQSEKIKYGVLPIENSSTGGITEVYDLLRRYDCQIIGEHYLKIEQNLLAVPGATMETVKTVYSHPQGFEQCRNFFKKHPEMTFKPLLNTAQSAKMVSESGDKTLGAIASRQAAKLYNLQVLAPDINSSLANYTRFIIISKTPETRPDADKITLVLVLKHEPGSLYNTLGILCKCGLNMVSLESRPIEGKSWEYFFHIDLTGNLTDPKVQEALSNLKDKCSFCKVLGNYVAENKRM